ncbi:LOW QUALITY PROTEIN: hypothetical protein PHMEG_00023516 [Phytophthora megakarya]|uniref:Uncharacterized protein n=1 Tax=Phytophthora megakarya TaxID=4795 RepID=A0A225VG54_9STRA|nr:LOW QUALITY PROTEIN: hypothetical protein PHMEG_00023516 [Phytophthora megakarya]
MDGSSVGSPSTSATDVARADCPHLADTEWEALQRLSTVIGEATVATMLRTLSQTEQHGVALGFIMREQREVASAKPVSPGETPRKEYLKLRVSNYMGRESETLLRWLVELDTAIRWACEDLSLPRVPESLEAAITLTMQEEFSLKQAKLHTNVPRPPRPAAKTEGPEPMDLSYASAVGQQKKKGSKYAQAKVNVAIPGIVTAKQKPTRTSAGRPTGKAVTRVYNGHAVLRTAAPSERESHCKVQDDMPNLVIL